MRRVTAALLLPLILNLLQLFIIFSRQITNHKETRFERNDESLRQSRIGENELQTSQLNPFFHHF